MRAEIQMALLFLFFKLTLKLWNFHAWCWRLLLMPWHLFCEKLFLSLDFIVAFRQVFQHVSFFNTSVFDVQPFFFLQSYEQLWRMGVSIFVPCVWLFPRIFMNEILVLCKGALYWLLRLYVFFVRLQKLVRNVPISLMIEPFTLVIQP